MILHIVRSGENISKIADNYQCEISDITSNNLHITDFSHLQPGTKLRIPFLTKETIEVLEETESFVKDYYPVFDDKKKNLANEKETEKVEEIKEEIIPNNDQIKEVIETIEKEPEIKENSVLEEQQITPKKHIQSYGYYSGNIIPKIPNNFIRKI